VFFELCLALRSFVDNAHAMLVFHLFPLLAFVLCAQTANAEPVLSSNLQMLIQGESTAMMFSWTPGA
jgi:hypothetical protein